MLEIGKKYSRHDDMGARISFPFEETVGEYEVSFRLVFLSLNFQKPNSVLSVAATIRKLRTNKSIRLSD